MAAKYEQAFYVDSGVNESLIQLESWLKVLLVTPAWKSVMRGRIADDEVKVARPSVARSLHPPSSFRHAPPLSLAYSTQIVRTRT